MSEKKKKFVPFKDAAVPRRPFILRSDREVKEPEKVKIEKPAEKEKQPTILLKLREPSTPKDENRPHSPKPQQSTDYESPTPSKIAQNENKEKKIIEQRVCAPIPPMPECVKLLDDKLEFNSAAGEFLHDSNSSYLVVGILGVQGVGKSMILNILAHDKPFDDLCARIMTSHEITQTKYEDDAAAMEEQADELQFEENSEEKPQDVAEQYFKFKMQDIDQIEHAQHCTKGIDMYVTTNRVILLDTQPILSPSVLEEGSVSGATPVTVRGSTVATVDCLQIASYLMAVCHVLIVTQDWFTDFNFLRFIQTAEMLKPSLTAAGLPATDGTEAVCDRESAAHILLLHNRCQLEHYRPDCVSIQQQLCRKVFEGSKLQLYSGMYMYSDQNRNGPSVEPVCAGMSVDTCGPPINMFLLPEIYDDYENMEIYRGHPPFVDLAQRLRWTVFGVHRHHITNVANLSEKGWFHYSTKAWESIRKCSFYLEYGRLLP